MEDHKKLTIELKHLTDVVQSTEFSSAGPIHVVNIFGNANVVRNLIDTIAARYSGGYPTETQLQSDFGVLRDTWVALAESVKPLDGEFMDAPVRRMISNGKSLNVIFAKAASVLETKYPNRKSRRPEIKKVLACNRFLIDEEKNTPVRPELGKIVDEADERKQINQSVFYNYMLAIHEHQGDPAKIKELNEHIRRTGIAPKAWDDDAVLARSSEQMASGPRKQK